MSINRVCISGNLVSDCAKRGNGECPIVLFTVAVNGRVKENGEWVNKADFVDCKLFGNYAKALAPSLTKGVKVALEGRLKQDRWEDEDGNKRAKLYVVANEMEVFAQRDEPKNDKGGDTW